MQFRILGPVQLWVGGQAHPLGEPRQQAIMAALLVEAGRAVSVDTLVDRVWGLAPPPQARRSLQAHLAKLRRALDTAGAGGHLLGRVSGGYRLQADPGQVDVLRFRQLLARARSGTEDDALRAALLREALGLCRGEPLAGIDSPWADRLRQSLHEEQVEATVMWAHTEIRLGNAGSVVGPLTDLAQQFPLLETAAAALMAALDAAGRPADALDRYHRLRQHLRDELGADPGPQAQALYHRLLHQPPVAPQHAYQTVLRLDFDPPPTHPPPRPNPHQGGPTAGHHADNGTELADPFHGALPLGQQLGDGTAQARPGHGELSAGHHAAGGLTAGHPAGGGAEQVQPGQGQLSHGSWEGGGSAPKPGQGGPSQGQELVDGRAQAQPGHGVTVGHPAGGGAELARPGEGGLSHGSWEGGGSVPMPGQGGPARGWLPEPGEGSLGQGWETGGESLARQGVSLEAGLALADGPSGPGQEHAAVLEAGRGAVTRDAGRDSVGLEAERGAVTREAGWGGVPVPWQLPADARGFVGRESELEALDRAAAPSGEASVIVCVTGTAGVGKTALAVRWGHSARGRFPDGQLYVNLRGYDPEQPADPAEALATLLTALVPGEVPPPEVDQRAARLRTALACKRMLLLLDNASSVEQVRPLLPGAAGCTVVITSRDSLAGLVALDGAHRVGLDLLPPHDAMALLGNMIGERVAAQPRLAAALADSCARLPLALRIAAEIAISRPAVTLAELVEELREQGRLNLLSDSADSRAAVRAVFSWSLRHLDPMAAQAFRVLGWHPGPHFDSYAMAALLHGERATARAVLQTLARAHLVHAIGADRYGFHDLLRDYAHGLALQVPGDEAPARLRDFYLATAAAAMQRLHPGEVTRWPKVPQPHTPMPEMADAASATGWLHSQMDNLVAMCGRDWPFHTIALSEVLFRHLDGGHDFAALAVHGQARTAAEAIGDLAAQAHALNAIGASHAQAGRHRAAAEIFGEALTLVGQLDDPVVEARTLGNLGTVEERQGRYGPAAEHYRLAATRYHGEGDLTGEAHALTRLGAMQARLGRGEEAAEHLQKALALHRRASHDFGQAWALTGIGEVEARAGRPALAVARHSEALLLFRRLGHRTSEAWALDSLGTAENQLGRHREAGDRHRQALVLFRELGERAGEAWALNGLGEADAAAGQSAKARAHHRAALAVAEGTGARDQQARAHAGLARLAEDVKDAQEHSELARQIYADLGIAPGAGLAAKAQL